MPFLPLFIVIGIFLATSKILQPSQPVQKRSSQRTFDDVEDQSLSLALIDYISRESKQKAVSHHGHTSSSKSGNRKNKDMRKR